MTLIEILFPLPHSPKKKWSWNIQFGFIVWIYQDSAFFTFSRIRQKSVWTKKTEISILKISAAILLFVVIYNFWRCTKFQMNGLWSRFKSIAERWTWQTKEICLFSINILERVEQWEWNYVLFICHDSCWLHRWPWGVLGAWDVIMYNMKRFLRLSISTSRFLSKMIPSICYFE